MSTRPDSISLLLVGCGKMGAALLNGWLKKGLAFDTLTIIDPAVSSSFIPAGATVIPSVDMLDPSSSFDCIFLAVKPQSLPDILPVYATRFSGKDTLFISIAAGKTLSFYESILGKQAVVRAMPNTPAVIGQGITAAIAGRHINETQRSLAHQLLSATGEFLWLEDETLMDAVTAISGSGPAYVFYFMEALVAAAENAGLDAATAKKLVAATLSGSAAMAATSELSLAHLREQVTSPGGTTQAALSVLMGTEDIAPALDNAIKNAIARAKELSDK